MSAKKWLIGCGGCLVFVILLVVLGTVGTAMWCGSSVDSASMSLLGSKPPKGYFAMGMTFPDEGGTTAGLMLTNPATSNVIFAFDHKMTAQEAAAFKNVAPASKEFHDALQTLVKKGVNSSSGNSDTQIFIEEVHSQPLKNGKKLAIVSMKLFSVRKGVYTPLAMGLAPGENNRLVLVAAVANPAEETNSSIEKDVDFSEAYAGLTEEVTGIVTDTELDDRIR